MKRGMSVVVSSFHCVYHLAQNYYSFDALQFDCFRINIKTVTSVISPGGDFSELI